MPTGWRTAILRFALAPVVCLALVSSADAARARKVRSAQAAKSHDTDGRLVDVRFWSLADATRVAIELNADFQFRTDRLSNPDRLFFDIAGVKPSKNPKGTEIIPVGDSFVRQIRIAETVPGTTRVVLDLNGAMSFRTSQLANPDRLIVEVIAPSKPSVSPLAPSSTSNLPAPTQTAEVERTMRATAAPPPALDAAKQKGAPLNASPEGGAKVETVETPYSRTPDGGAPSPLAAKRNSTGDRSMTRVLGLKLGRVVLDAGHGGHDGGTRGPSGLLEKDLVLDVTRRLGALIEDRLGSEVVYTRRDDTFVPLEERTKIANRHKADLFLSIHANSSPQRTASGVETYYLNFTTNKAALEVAARENASSERSIYDLRDLVQKIALKDKLEESREFAAKVQASLTTLSSRTNTKSRDRGVKKAPFVVLIGASMPSILAEIGFVSNPQDEGLMKKAEYRQRLAEALYKGVSQYAAGLSRFQVAGQRRSAAGE